MGIRWGKPPLQPEVVVTARAIILKSSWAIKLVTLLQTLFLKTEMRDLPLISLGFCPSIIDEFIGPFQN